MRSLPLIGRLFTICALLLLVGATPAFCQDRPRPNIIFILADDLGWGDLGCFGQKHIRTPHIDRLATEGTRFTNVYAGASVCAPSRSVLMTGQHTGHTRVRGNAALTGGVGLYNEWRLMQEAEETIEQYVLARGGSPVAP